MTVLYFDTSALAKRYNRESGHDRVKRLINNPSNNVVLSNIGVVEMASVFWKKHRNQEISERVARLLFSRFKYDTRSDYYTLSVTSQHLAESLSLIELHGLKTLDAIHYATAKHVERNSPRFQFVSADQEHIDAARNDGMTFVDLV